MTLSGFLLYVGWPRVPHGRTEMCVLVWRSVVSMRMHTHTHSLTHSLIHSQLPLSPISLDGIAHPGSPSLIVCIKQNLSFGSLTSVAFEDPRLIEQEGTKVRLFL